MEIGYAYFSNNHTILKEYARQLGIKHAVTNTSSGSRGCSAYVHPWDFMPLLRKKQDFAAYGNDFSVYEGVDFIDSAKLGLPDKDDAGKTDMYEAMKCYYEVGFDGVARPDHVPTMANDSVEIPGYGINGNLLATGYMLELMEAARKEAKK